MSAARSAARAKRSPTTEPIEPPMKAKSNEAATRSRPLSLPCMAISASRSPVDFCAALMRSEYFFWSLNFSTSVGPSSAPISVGAVGVEQRGQARAGADRHVEIALRADLEVFLELRAVQHDAAAVALLPQPFGHAAPLGRAPESVRMPDGISFFSQDMRCVFPFRL